MLRKAVKDPSNYKPIIFCTLTMVAIGIIMAIFGLVLVLLDHIELGPPQYDSEWERYNGSSLPGIIGPMFIAFGTFLALGNICLLFYAARSYYKHPTVTEGANM